MQPLLVRDVMTTRVVTVSPDLAYKQIVDLLIEFGVSAVPVVDAERRVLGVVSEADLLRKVELEGGDTEHRLFERRRRREARTKAAGEDATSLMTAPAVTVTASATLTEAARLMEQRHVKRLPVLDDAGNLAGIVSRRDLLRRYLRDDEAIRADVHDGVLRGILWIEPSDVFVSVRDGHVTLTGHVDRRTTAQIATRLVRRLDGVVGVTDEGLEWRFDDTTVQHRYTFDV